MPSNPERMAVNAAIERLIAQTDEDGEAARTVIAYGAKLKRSKAIQIRYSSDAQSGGDSVSGYSPGHGDISIEDKERSEHKEWSFGVYKDRIGHYRLWKESEGLLKFHHFWKSDITTKAPDDAGPDQFHLGYDQASQELRYLGVLRQRVLCQLHLGLTVKIVWLYLERIYGTARMPMQNPAVHLSI